MFTSENTTIYFLFLCMVEASADTATFPGHSRTETQGLYMGELNKPQSRGLGGDPLGLNP